MSISAQELIAVVEKMTVEERGRLMALLREEPRPKKESVLPDGEGGDAPTAEDYRIPAEDIKAGVCNGRRLTEPDRRWKPAIYGEVQCGGTVSEDGLCAVCVRRLAKYTEGGGPKVGWLGRLTEEPMEWCHMLETKWAEEKKPVWGAGSVVEASAVSSKAEKEAAAAAKKAEKEAAAAAKKAEKEAAAAAKKAEKAAKKATKEKNE
jgi:hypothetical protein